MNRQQQIEEIKNIVLKESEKFYRLKCDEACAYCEASALYNAGYRKTFTSEIASKTQKAFKEGYEKGCEACTQSWNNGYNDGYESGKEDTAKEILQGLYNEAISNVSETVELSTFQIEKLADKFGVGVEE